MCLFGGMKPPVLAALPPTPSASDKDVQAREAALRQQLAANDGTAGTVKTDLSPSSLTGPRRVLLGV